MLPLAGTPRARHAAAAAGFVRSLEGLEAEQGPSHPFTAHVRANYCRTLSRLGDRSGTLAQCRKARADLAAAFGPDHDDVRWVDKMLAAALQDLERRAGSR